MLPMRSTYYTAHAWHKHQRFYTIQTTLNLDHSSKKLACLLLLLALFYMPDAMGCILMCYAYRRSVNKHAITHAFVWRHRHVDAYIQYQKKWYAAKVQVTYAGLGYIRYIFISEFNAKMPPTVLNIPLRLLHHPRIQSDVRLLTHYLQHKMQAEQKNHHA